MKLFLMKIYRLLCLIALSLVCFTAFGQEVETASEPVEVNYDQPQTYYVGGVLVEGNTHFGDQQIISLTGLQKGMQLTVPSDEITSIVQRLWSQRYFEDVALAIDHLNAAGDSAWFKISIKERPRVSAWLFSGVKKGEEKDLRDRLSLRRGGEFSEYVATTSTGIIKKYYSEKGFLNCEVDVQTQKDSIIKVYKEGSDIPGITNNPTWIKRTPTVEVISSPVAKKEGE